MSEMRYKNPTLSGFIRKDIADVLQFDSSSKADFRQEISSLREKLSILPFGVYSKSNICFRLKKNF